MLLLLIYLENRIFSVVFSFQWTKHKRVRKKTPFIINCLYGIVIISLFIAFDCSMQQNSAEEKGLNEPGRAFKQFIDKKIIRR